MTSPSHHTIQHGAAEIRQRDPGVHFRDGFDGSAVDEKLWRIWHTNKDAVRMTVEDGHFVIRAKGQVAHNGLWQLNASKYKDLALVGWMDFRDPSGHQNCIIHFCGGDKLRSPDHWVDLAMVDRGDHVDFTLHCALPREIGYEKKPLTLARGDDAGFVVKLDMDPSSNTCSGWVLDGGRWVAVGDPVMLPLRTVHNEIKIRSTPGLSLGDDEGQCEARFDDVRIYPRPETHHVMVRLVTPEGEHVSFKEHPRSWPPQIHVEGQAPRELGDLEVQLLTADGELVSASRSDHFGDYLLPLKDAEWLVYPVAARIRLMLDGKRLGDDLPIERAGLDGLYPDSVWDVVVR